MTTSSHQGQDGAEEIVIYSHSPILYWWPVWLYAAFCFVVTYCWHEPINPGGLKDVNVFPHPWLGVSFVFVFFFVLTFSNLKMQGPAPVIVVMAIALLIIGAEVAFGLDWMLRKFRLLFIYANEAFYAAVGIYLFAFWFIVVFIVDRMRSHHFKVGQIIEKDPFGGGKVIPDARHDRRAAAGRLHPAQDTGPVLSRNGHRRLHLHRRRRTTGVRQRGQAGRWQIRAYPGHDPQGQDVDVTAGVNPGRMAAAQRSTPPRAEFIW